MKKIQLSESTKLWLQQERLKTFAWKKRLNDKGYAVYPMQNWEDNFYELVDAPPELKTSSPLYHPSITQPVEESIPLPTPVISKSTYEKFSKQINPPQTIAEQCLLYEIENNMLPDYL